jgi:PAS domain S-box-containing protein
MSRLSSSWERYALAIAAVAAASFLYLAAAPAEIDSDLAYFGLSAAVLFSSAVAGPGPAVLATVLGALVSVNLFTSSALSLQVGFATESARLIIFVSQGVLLALIGDVIRNARTEEVYMAWRTRYLRSFLFVLAATGVKLVAWWKVEYDMPFVFYYAATAAAAWLGGVGPGLLATLTAALCARLFFMDPVYSLSVSSPIAAVRLGLFIVEGIAISAIAGKHMTARRAANRAIQRMRQYGDLLLQSTVRARALQTLSKDVVWEWDLPPSIAIREDADSVSGNGAASTFTSWLSGVHPRDRLKVLASLKAAMQEGVAEWCEEYRRLLPGKGYVCVSDHAFILRDSARHPVRVIGRTTEAVATNRSPEDVEREGAYEALFENNPHAMLLTDRRLHIVDANNAACDVLGYSRDAITKRCLHDVLPWAARGIILGLTPEDSFSTFEEDCLRATGEVFRAKITAAMLSGMMSADRVITIEETADAEA